MRHRKLKLALIALLISAAVTVAVAEMLLRAAGFEPWKRLTRDRDWGAMYEPDWGAMYEPDPLLGWRSKPGRYTVKAFVPEEEDLKVTIRDGGRRRTGSEAKGTRPRLAFVGCSYTEGQWLSDEETFAWKLQAKYPAIEVQNYGVAGYGTYQSLLLLEKIFAAPDPPKIVLYGFIDTHTRRNVAAPEFLESVARHSRKSYPQVPYVTLDGEGELQRHPPQAYPAWPLRQYSALVNFVQHISFRFLARKRVWDQAEITEKLLLEMKRLANRHGAHFAVIMLAIWDPEPLRLRFIEFLIQNKIDYLDCDYPRTAEFGIPGDGHPNDKKNTLYAHCIANGIRDQLSALATQYNP